MDEEEFGEFFRCVRPELVRYARQLFHSSAADDLVSKTMETIWRKDLPAPTDAASFFKLRALAFKVLRRHGGHLAREEQARRQRESTYAIHATSSMIAPDFVAELVDSPWPVWTESLSEEERLLLVLLVYRYKAADIAPILGIKPSAVTTRVRRLRIKSQGLWAQEARDDEE
ncbi:MAG: hypothetical protein QM655_04295 [Nocardioidaceae bacterium]